MASRLKLQEKLEELLGSRNVYYQSPSNLVMKYPAIKYSISSKGIKKANNQNYNVTNRYEIIVIDPNVDNEVIDKILELPYCSYNTHYVKDNLHHTVLSLYY